MKTSTSPRSPLSPTLWPAEAFRWYGSLGIIGLLLFTSIVPPAIFVAILLVFHAATMAQLKTFSWPVVLAQFSVYALWLVILGTLLPMVAKRPLSALGLRVPRLGDLGWGLLGAVLMIVIAGVAGALQEHFFHLKPDEVQVHWLREARGSLIAGFVVLACVAAPVLEELTFRGFIFNAFLRYTPAWVAALLSSAMFGLAHFMPGNAGALIPLAAGGLVLSAVYYRTGSLIASMFTHAVFNAFTVVLVLVFHQG